ELAALAGVVEGGQHGDLRDVSRAYDGVADLGFLVWHWSPPAARDGAPASAIGWAAPRGGQGGSEDSTQICHGWSDRKQLDEAVTPQIGQHLRLQVVLHPPRFDQSARP